MVFNLPELRVHTLEDDLLVQRSAGRELQCKAHDARGDLDRVDVAERPGCVLALLVYDALDGVGPFRGAASVQDHAAGVEQAEVTAVNPLCIYWKGVPITLYTRPNKLPSLAEKLMEAMQKTTNTLNIMINRLEPLFMS